MQVFVAINYTRDHEREVVGVAATAEAALSILEQRRKEPLRLDVEGWVNNYPPEGPPDCVGCVTAFTVEGAA